MRKYLVTIRGAQTVERMEVFAYNSGMARKYALNGSALASTEPTVDIDLMTSMTRWEMTFVTCTEMLRVSVEETSIIHVPVYTVSEMEWLHRHFMKYWTQALSRTVEEYMARIQYVYHISD